MIPYGLSDEKMKHKMLNVSSHATKNVRPLAGANPCHWSLRASAMRRQRVGAAPSFALLGTPITVAGVAEPDHEHVARVAALVPDLSAL